ncbi:hypothetical protein TWF569_008900 [Orbilia oligospora]|uniref:Uncharacterized protein n=1 Tax=Orbilia oligospora TaxID=2813651 RepID=A0A7C8P1G1_ORBOL|nr:hypothetical protein TWF706_010615 [Orbilia oligospora]KAF3139874.1 hypothetical protein TWF703_003452 [Orbilia oligospora]KAF3143129.1 hypothetical protein TWF594_005198 [Orbilia oligospora]KAF3155532.1 hypothetical protein TWF569_008900 [Orbilia oligospora]KAF3157876.1 hypothetical protein TWF751_002106 [Orbilia oligospora]
MYSTRAAVERWQERNTGYSHDTSGHSIALETIQIKPEVVESRVALGKGGYQKLFSPETLQCFIAIVIEVLIILLIVLFNLVEVTLTMPGLFPNDSRALYVCGTTIFITAITAFVSRQIRLQWIQYIEARRLRKSDILQSSRRIESLLGVGTYSDYFYYWGTTITLLFASLSTAAIVAAITPSIGFKTFGTIVQLTPGALNCTTVSDDPSPTALSWRLENGTYINFRAKGNNCLANPAFSIVNAISNSAIDKDGYAYAVSGVGVTRSSIGVPYDAHNGPAGFDKVFWAMGINQQDRNILQDSTQCLPVFIANPAKCRRAGTIIRAKNNLTVRLDEDCSASTPIFGADLESDGASASGYCTSGKSVGKVTYLIGSINSHAGLLAAAVSDFPAVNSKSYSVACEVDIVSAVGFRDTTISRNYKPPHESSINRENENLKTLAEYTISSPVKQRTSSSCSNKSYVPIWNPENKPGVVLTPGALAVGAGAACPLFMQNRYNNGWWDTLSRAVKDRGPSSYAFEDSKNALEDVLGLVVGVSMGQYIGSSQPPASTRDAPMIVNRGGSARVLGYRIGSGSKWGLIFIAPQVWIILVLSVLLIKRLRL